MLVQHVASTLTLISNKSTCFAFASELISEVAIEEPGWVTWKPIPETSCKQVIGTKTKGLNLNVKSKYKERLTKYVNNAAFSPFFLLKFISCYLRINQAFMLMAPNYQVQKTWQEELTDTIARTCLFSAEIQNIISDQEAQTQNRDHKLL